MTYYKHLKTLPQRNRTHLHNHKNQYSQAQSPALRNELKNRVHDLHHPEDSIENGSLQRTKSITSSCDDSQFRSQRSVPFHRQYSVHLQSRSIPTILFPSVSVPGSAEIRPPGNKETSTDVCFARFSETEKEYLSGLGCDAWFVTSRRFLLRLQRKDESSA